MRRISNLILIFISSLFIIIPLCGCSSYQVSNVNDEYKQITINRGLAKFSFEYPSILRLSPVDIKSDHTLFAIADESFYWDCLIERVSKEKPSIEDAIDYNLMFYTGKPNYTIRDRSDIKINGIPGEQVTISYDSIPAPVAQGGIGGQLVPSIDLIVYFEYDNLLWGISASSNTSNYELNKVYFKHMLETFKISG